MTERPKTFYEMVRHLSRNYDHLFDDLFPQGDEAIRISLSSDINVKALKDTIDPMGWFVTIESKEFIAVEPRYTKRCPLEDGAHLYHVTYRSCRDSIVKDGLNLSKGRGTDLQRTYPARIFFSLTLCAAFEFVPFKLQSDNVLSDEASSPQTASLISPKHSEKDIDIYRVTAQKEIEYYRDPFFPGKAVWCEVPISPEHLELIGDWHGVKRQMIAVEHSG